MSRLSTIAAYTLLLGLSTVTVQAESQNVSYFDGKENQNMSIQSAEFSPGHPNCADRKPSEVVIPQAEGDADGDGVLDSKDKCPNTPKGYQVDVKGCPKSVTLHVNFAFASNIMPESSNSDVRELVEFMRNNPASKVNIVGHTDNVGIDARNQPRSEARARALADKLIENGIDASRITSMGKGSKDPVATNTTAEGRALNRRIEVVIH